MPQTSGGKGKKAMPFKKAAKKAVKVTKKAVKKAMPKRSGGYGG